MISGIKKNLFPEIENFPLNTFYYLICDGTDDKALAENYCWWIGWSADAQGFMETSKHSKHLLFFGRQLVTPSYPKGVEREHTATKQSYIFVEDKNKNSSFHQFFLIRHEKLKSTERRAESSFAREPESLPHPPWVWGVRHRTFPYNWCYWCESTVIEMSQFCISEGLARRRQGCVCLCVCV